MKLQFNRLHSLNWILSIKMRTFEACGGVRMHPVHPPWLRAWALCLRVWQMTSNLVLYHGQSLLGLLSHLLTWLSHFVPCKSLSMSHQSHQSTPMDSRSFTQFTLLKAFSSWYVLIVFACYSCHCKIALSRVLKLWSSFYCFMLFQYEVF